MRIWTSLLLLGGLVAACDSSGGGASGESGSDSAPTSSDPGGNTDGTTTAEPSAGSTTNGPTGTTSGPSVSSSGDDDDPVPPINFDFGGIPDVGELDDGCNAVDFLFVIDNSGSMGTAQANLLANFPAFINGIQATLSDVESYHVGIASSDAYSGNPVACRQLGALVTSTAGYDSSNSVCGPYTEGFNYITEQDDLTTAFQCAAQIGTSGSAYELMATAMESAISEPLNAEGACNEGFIRDNALLVVVLITDESDGPGDTEGSPPTNTSAGTPQTWFDSVVAAKNDTPENAAALVLTNYAGGPCPPQYDSEDGSNLVEFAALFGENGFTAGICEPDYGPSFANATAVIQQACENFIPPG